MTVIVSRITAAMDTRPATNVIGSKPVKASSTPRKLAPQIMPSVIRIAQFKSVPGMAFFVIMRAKIDI